MLLVPVVLSAQAPDQAWRDRMKALAPLADTQATFQVSFRANLTYGGKPKGKVVGERILAVRTEGRTLKLEANPEQPAQTWALPLALLPWEEDPAKPRTLEAWLQPHRLQAWLHPAAALAQMVDRATLKDVKEDLEGGRIVQMFTYRFKTSVPEELDDRAHTREATLQVWVGPPGVPLKAEIATGYRGRFGRWHPFTRSTQVRWAFEVEGGRLVTRSLDLRDSHLDDWDGTGTLLGVTRK
jgi:hypothetical protein